MSKSKSFEEPNGEEQQLDAVEFLRRMVESRPGGEHRPQQEHMVNLVSEAIQNASHLLVQSGTGTGKTFGYAVPAAISGKRAIISTATKHLSEQIVDKDLPVLSAAYERETGDKLSYALVKGRHNYLCKKKLDDLTRMDSRGAEQDDLSSMLGDTGGDIFAARKKRSTASSSPQADEFAEIFEWAKTTNTGDRSHGPAVSEKTWVGVSSTNSECPGKSVCPFGQECFAERARDIGRAVDIVVTNHAVVGNDLQEEQGNILGQRDVLIADELHELDKYLSSAWGTQLTPKMVHDAVVAGRRATAANMHDIRKDIDALESEVEEFTAILIMTEDKRLDTLPKELSSSLKVIADISNRLDLKFSMKSSDAENKREKANYKVAAQRIRAIHESATLLLDESGEVVRWTKRSFKQTEDDPTTLFASPLRIGPRLMSALEENDITFIGTSATITVAGEFEIPKRNLAMDEPIKVTENFVITERPPRPSKAEDTGTPFDYKRQAIHYTPHPDNFPSPVGKERIEHSKAVLAESTEFLKASGGRALFLSATTKGALEAAEHFRKKLKTPILLQGDAPAPQLVDEFKNVMESTLVATLGMWHGLDVPGPTNILTMIDKIPFGPMDDPLMTARQEDIVSRGGNGFMDVYVADANIMLAQGIGRLIRSMTDRGVVATFDPRLISKRYGPAMMRSLPPMYRTSDKAQVIRSLKNL